MTVFRFKEYSSIPRSTFSAEEWTELEAYVRYLAERAGTLFADERIEERPFVGWDPTTGEPTAKFGGYVGRYEFLSGTLLDLQPSADKLPDDSYARMIKDLTAWAMLQGTPFVSSILNFVGGPVSGNSVYAFSPLVRAISEATLFGYIPPAVYRENRVGPEQIGPLNVSRTMKRLAIGRKEVVSVRTRLEPDSLPMLLLLRFNAELASDLEEAARSIPGEYAEILPSRKAVSWKEMHWGLAHLGRGPTALDSALGIDFEEPRVLLRVEREARTAELKDMVQTWIAYRSGALPEISVQEELSGLLGNGLRPLSKLYELWCLRCLVLALEVALDLRWESVFTRIPGSIRGVMPDGGSVVLRYNETQESAWLTQIRSVFPGLAPRPDFMVEIRHGSSRRTVVLDAKYKLRESIAGADLQRLVWYGTLFSSSSDAAIDIGLLHLDPQGMTSIESMDRKDPQISAYVLGLQPSRSIERLTSFLAELV